MFVVRAIAVVENRILCREVTSLGAEPRIDILRLDGDDAAIMTRGRNLGRWFIGVPEGFSVFNTSVTAPVCFRLKRLPDMAFTHWKSAALAGHTPIAAIGYQHLIERRANVAQVLNNRRAEMQIANYRSGAGYLVDRLHA